jgi:hypothetical protein
MGPDQTEPITRTDSRSCAAAGEQATRGRPDWIWLGSLLVLSLASLVLKCLDPDQISFRYDSAMAFERVRQWFQGGEFPLTGIENSLGFRNTGALVWLLMIPGAFSAKPEAMACFQGLLWALAVWPVGIAVLLATSSRGLALVAAAAFALLPSGTFAARGIWAQNVLPPLMAWSLCHAIWILHGNHGNANIRRHLIGATAPAWYGALIHMAAGFPAAILTGLLAAQRTIPVRHRLVLLVPVVAAGILSAPSLLDGWRSRSATSGEVPAHVAQFEELLPDAPTLPSRLVQMLAALPAPLLTSGADGGLGTLLPEKSPWLMLILALDLFLIIATGLAVAFVVIEVIRPREHLRAPKPICRLLLLLLLVPPVACALLVSRPNPSYIAGLYPVVLVVLALGAHSLLGVLPASRVVSQVLAALVMVVLVASAAYPTVVQHHARTCYPPWPVAGQYYLPLSDQRRVAAWLNREGITPENVHHVSGDYFGEPYRILMKSLPRARRSGRFAVIEDIPLRARKDQGHAEWLREKAVAQIGTVAIILSPSREDGLNLLHAFSRLPLTASSEKAPLP